ncbi:hypothetical protein F4558_004375 [Micromonospora profundi]|uniref:hypothetical protein n=2 Tax=Micromonospora profundi TaxID=1420889 RepID=UPI0016A75894|nr:hypothetical protein [Micromonospora profundi]NJC14549.1 hypothetical protein [Micromonospora profundi]
MTRGQEGAVVAWPRTPPGENGEVIMSVRRRAARFATVCGLVGALVMLGASPALAADDSVRVGSASSFAAGGSAQGVNVAVRKRSEGCVLLRTALGLRLEGLEPGQVTVQVNAGGRWFPVSVSGGGGSVSTAQTSPAKPTLCKGKGITVRYRVAFAAGAPGGRLAVTGVGVSAAGQELGRGSDTAKVAGAKVSASPTPSKKPSPTPSPTETTPADPVTPAALAAESGTPSTVAAAAESSGGGSLVMFFGIAMVAVGLLLIGLLFRRSRQDRAPADEPVQLPGNPGGTTYRSGGGSPPAPGRPGAVYGQQQSGGYGVVPSPRPATGGVYGAPPAAPTPDATQPMPGAGGTPGVGPRPGHTPPPDDGGDHTMFMPRLPG